MAANEPIQKKMVIVGDSFCGKTCLYTTFVKDRFPVDYVPRVFESFLGDIRVDGKTVELGYFDTVGDDQYDSLRPFSYSNTDVILMCFSIDNPES